MKGPAGLCHTRSIPQTATFCLNGDVHELGRLRAAVEQFRVDHSLDSETGFRLNLVLEELFVNAIRHGGCDGIENAACVHLTCLSDSVHVDFRDRGGPFNLTEASEADIHAPLAERGEGGLGIHLVRQIMRQVAYRREGDWNVLTMQQPVAEPQETL